jgi:ferredoxin-thioredoxin reductase catalytic chain
MSIYPDVSAEEIDSLYKKLHAGAGKSGYHLNPDAGMVRELVRGLVVNEKRYGYRACPCRLATGRREEDLDIVCPCDYRDADVAEHDACYCGLYVSKRVIGGEGRVAPIPERRPPEGRRVREQNDAAPSSRFSSTPLPVWRCAVCGYLCAREAPPDECPICRADSERFERFM